MAAGIISANLPTLRPAFRFMARMLGIGENFGVLFGSTNKTRTRTTKGATQPSETEESTAAIIRSKQNRHSFYHLPDDSDSVAEHMRMEASFRPDYDHSKTYTNVKGAHAGHNSDSDEIPLSEIRVNKEFTQTATP